MSDIRTPIIYLLRHGRIRSFPEKTYIGQADIPLSQEGIGQAEAWREFFRNRLPETIFCSDLARSLVTATIIAEAFSDRICVRKELREISLGRWEGIAMAEIRKNFPEQWELRGRNLKQFRPPGGESFSDLSRRVLPVFYDICSQSSGDVLIVSHAGVNRVILADIMGIDLNHILQISQNYAALNIISAGKTGMEVIRMNITLMSYMKTETYSVIIRPEAPE